jgi:phospholipid/cholesterol/gamma-HCH transport system substrate-binding protein
MGRVGRCWSNSASRSNRSKSSPINLGGLVSDTRPAAKHLQTSTLPQAEAAIRDLRASTKALRDLTEKINTDGAGSLLSGQKLPDYKPERK